ncbi:TrkA family potassium uptake protein [Marinobacter nanhaiticus D15-8W]|uniref:TrkA family potassium uptake protein n=1 Tax=Marinobacter nanhaiticus D15-8W TaxID=626887 RepID=N6WY70_9GAMM|nr:TrkA family potassium uptake protein [Marinobacter nanhaiticus]ENO16556.1 TrkA family potassium uptake protein [Marinobacter nanhaiticus D15-8W]BES72348.1 TrkA family potassium uptake protein [Marinobacter nanhaiticus D15-8W]
MIERQQFVVIGLGVFGETIAKELTRLGHDVLGVDTDESRIDRLAESITHAVIADVTDENALKELDVGQYDVGVVAIDNDFEAAILATMQLLDMGIKKVWAKAITSQHHRILDKIGATRVIGPEFEMGVRVAQELNYPMVNNYIGLGDDEFVVEIFATDQLHDTALQELARETEAEVTLLVVKRGAETTINPADDFVLHKGDQIVLAGTLTEFRKLADRI